MADLDSRLERCSSRGRLEVSFKTSDLVGNIQKKISLASAKNNMHKLRNGLGRQGEAELGCEIGDS
jgi:hypothetical protein